MLEWNRLSNDQLANYIDLNLTYDEQAKIHIPILFIQIIFMFIASFKE